MSKKKGSTPATGGATKKHSRKTGKAALLAKVQNIQNGLSALLAPRYNGIGDIFTEGVKKAQEALLPVAPEVKELPDDWKPPVHRLKKLTPEQLKKLEERVARDRARLEEAKAQLQPET